jgi:putative ATPase
MRPLAERMRPKNIDSFIGQSALLGEGMPIRRWLDAGRIPSIILWGPPGVGKTTLANLLAAHLNIPFQSLNAVHSGVKEVRDAIQKAEQQKFFNQHNPILFIDEIHRFSKSQQDSLLNAVEKGIVTLIGATTENPSFEVIPALLSRCQIYTLVPLNREELTHILNNSLERDEFLNTLDIELQEIEALIHFSGGDARKLLNLLELACLPDKEDKIKINNALIEKIAVNLVLNYDKDGEVHYDIASAFIKSIRGSDPQAAVYWLARMLAAGEDIKFIARRMIISAAEDIGLANPNALLMAQTAFQASITVGMPEARIILSEAVIYLAKSAKSNSAYLAINAAMEKVKETGNLPVPLHLRNAPTSLMKQLNYGVGYKYSHDFPGNYVEQTYLPEEIKEINFYVPQNNGIENKGS